jgi:glycogen operon protein
VEGETDDPAVLACRAAQQRNLLTTLMLSQGVPMLVAGDEIGRTQGGNNNAYCQDNEISWHDWSHVDHDLFEFTKRLIELRQQHPSFRRRRYFQGRPIRGTVDLGWCKPDGTEMTDDDWSDSHARSIGLFLNGESITDVDQRGQPLVDDSFLLLLNAHHELITWTLPTHWTRRWEVVLSTVPGPVEGSVPSVTVDVPARSVVVLSDGDAG